jgi:hypothetical protein
MCQKCGCNTCETNSTALMLNESKAPRSILSEGLKHHIDNNKPLTDNFYTAGSRDYFDLISEARSLYSRGILEFTNKRDIELLTETDQGYFGIYEGKKVPLDFPIELTENEIDKEKIILLNKILSTLKNSEKDGEDRESDIENLDVSIDQLTGALTGKDPVAVQFDQGRFGRFASLPDSEKNKLKEVVESLLDEAKFKGKTVQLNKPTRGDSKKFKVYVNSGKKNADGSIKVKKVNFGHGGSSAKKSGQKTMSIRKSNPKARKAFRARHRCDNPGPKTMARYWSCKKW